MSNRRITRKVFVGDIAIGGDAPISVQSMLNTPASDIENSIKQAQALEAAGCDIIRAAVPNLEAVKLIEKLKESVKTPIVADIHFDYRIALACVDAGVDKIRINPGNIGSADRVKAVADACNSKNIPIRIGVNSGSVEASLLEKYGGPTPEAMAESAMKNVELLEACDFKNIVISIKSSDVKNTVDAYRTVAKMCDYPLHIGVTEAGTYKQGIIKSSMGIGSLLLDGIGDTIRVSLTADPVNEIYAGFDILKAAGLKNDCVQLVSCPTCGRTKIDLIGLADKVEQAVGNIRKPIKVAVMGCAVNGPGEAREADIGVAGGDGCGLIFKKGEIIKKVSEDKILEELLKEIEKI
ncbi:MAG: flavodoxin-dependent (E)-4-hydroxy-3-methylbut-2-enyl-diphosphate synthase [Ruminococcaceae bacterium]|nr:flavodoxin-dependent (E)-4-hydroxy-3-methylbut-2-enyl-diphosphate synthase [Oscillospiraceae bacterium]